MKIEAINTVTGNPVFVFEALASESDTELIENLGAHLFHILYFETFIQQPAEVQDRVPVTFTLSITP